MVFLSKIKTEIKRLILNILFCRRISKITNILSKANKQRFPIGFDISDGSSEKLEKIEELISLREEVYDNIYFLENIVNSYASKSIINGIFEAYKDINDVYDHAFSLIIHSENLRF